MAYKYSGASVVAAFQNIIRNSGLRQSLYRAAPLMWLEMGLPAMRKRKEIARQSNDVTAVG